MITKFRARFKLRRISEIIDKIFADSRVRRSQMTLKVFRGQLVGVCAGETPSARFPNLEIGRFRFRFEHDLCVESLSMVTASLICGRLRE
jgi:hypothetical protein